MSTMEWGRHWEFLFCWSAIASVETSVQLMVKALGAPMVLAWALWSVPGSESVSVTLRGQEVRQLVPEMVQPSVRMTEKKSGRHSGLQMVASMARQFLKGMAKQLALVWRLGARGSVRSWEEESGQVMVVVWGRPLGHVSAMAMASDSARLCVILYLWPEMSAILKAQYLLLTARSWKLALASTLVLSWAQPMALQLAMNSARS
jgi:hypothetical protein